MTQDQLYTGAQMGDPSQPPAEGTVLDEFEGIVDTYAFGGTRVFTIDRKQSITFKVLTEGDKAKYQRATNRDIRVDRKTDSAHLRTDLASDRHALITISVVGWELYTRGSNGWERMSYSDAMLQNWLKVTDPAIVERLEETIRKANPWLNTENVTVEDIDKEIEELQARKNELLLQEAGKG